MRQALDESVWLKMCEDISRAVLSHPWFLQEKNIYTYIDYNREVETKKIIKTAFEMGKNVWVPKVTGKVMHFYRIESFEELNPGAYGILEPTVNELVMNEPTGREYVDGDSGKTAEMTAIDRIADVSEADAGCGLMIMPGVAFDEKCRRIGYGGGYYDRYLAEHPKLRRIALAFEFQVFPKVPHEEFDICPEVLITEKRQYF